MRLYWCDAFTREWLTSEGIEVNANETSPGDRYIASRHQPDRNHLSPSEVDSLHKFLTLDRVVLRFYATWDERDQLFGEVRKVKSIFDFYQNLNLAFFKLFKNHRIADFKVCSILVHCALLHGGRYAGDTRSAPGEQRARSVSHFGLATTHAKAFGAQDLSVCRERNCLW